MTEQAIRDRLPPGWALHEATVEAPDLRSRVDLLLTLSGPDGTVTTVVTDCKQVVEGRNVGPVVEQLTTYLTKVGGGVGLVGARYLPPQTRARLTERGISFVDVTGNIRLQIAKPALFIADRGADADPWRGPGRPRGTLKGPPAAGVVRAVTDFTGDWTVSELLKVSGVSTGAAYRVIDFLESEGLAERPGRGAISVPDWAAVLRRWSEDYGFVRNSRVTRWIAPRGLDDLLERAASKGIRYAVAGTFAAAEWAAYAPAAPP